MYMYSCKQKRLHQYISCRIKLHQSSWSPKHFCNTNKWYKMFFGISWCRFLLNALRNSAKFLRWFKWKLIGYGYGEHCLAVEIGNFHHLSSGFKIYFSHLNRKTISDPLPNITSVLVKFCFAIFWIVLGHHWNNHATYSSGKLSYKIAKYQEQCQRQNYK